MPPPRKIDLLPPELRQWLQDELKARGFGDYEALADALNDRLENGGQELRIGKSALHAYGQEYREFARIQEEAAGWAESWLTENGMEGEAQRHNVLFQMVSTLAFKHMKALMEKGGAEIDPKDLHFIGRMLKDVMHSSGIREKLVADERARVAAETRQQAADSLDESAKSLGLTGSTVEAIKSKILGVDV